MHPGQTNQLVLFQLDEQRYALPLSTVERVVRAAAITPWPAAPSIVLGALNVHGRVLPVLDVRQRFGLPARPIAPSDCFLLARAARRTVVLPVDGAAGVIERPHEDLVPSAEILNGLERFPGVLRLEDGLVLIHDLDSFLSLDEADALNGAMHESPEI